MKSRSAAIRLSGALGAMMFAMAGLSPPLRSHTPPPKMNSVPARGISQPASANETNPTSGAVGGSKTPRVITQRAVNVAEPSATAIYPATPLSTAEQVIVPTDPGLTQPDNDRALTATLIEPQPGGTALPVTIIGTNWKGERITETANVTGTTEFHKAFRSVKKIVLPARGTPGQQVSIGTSAKLGLHVPVTDANGLLRVSRGVAGTEFVPQAFNPADLDLVNQTLNISNVTDGASYEFTFRASE